MKKIFTNLRKFLQSKAGFVVMLFFVLSLFVLPASVGIKYIQSQTTPALITTQKPIVTVPTQTTIQKPVIDTTKQTTKLNNPEVCSSTPIPSTVTSTVYDPTLLQGIDYIDKGFDGSEYSCISSNGVKRVVYTITPYPSTRRIGTKEPPEVISPDLTSINTTIEVKPIPVMHEGAGGLCGDVKGGGYMYRCGSQ